jgi:hypothetical protein
VHDRGRPTSHLNILDVSVWTRATRGVLLKGEGASRVMCKRSPVALFALLAAYRRRID